MKQIKFLSHLLKKHKRATFIASLGTISYDLEKLFMEFSIPGGRHDIYLIRGAMGAAMGCGLGFALAKPKNKVIVLIGDGAFMMKQGSVNTIMKYKPKNLFVYILQNNVYASTGGQAISKIVTRLPKSHFRIVPVNKNSKRG